MHYKPHTYDIILIFRSEVNIHNLKERMDQNTEHARQQYSQLQEQCRLLQAETERRVREGEEHRKRVREKEQELQAVRASLEAGRIVGEERRDNSMEKVHDKLVSLERERVRLTEILENTRVTLSKTEQDLFDSQEQLADQRSMTEALRQERLRSSELAQETKELGTHLERIEVEKYDLQQDINRLLTERDQLDNKLGELQQDSIQTQLNPPRVLKHNLTRSLSETDIQISGEDKPILLEQRAYSPPIPATQALQTAFDSLQVRFVQVMRQKADLDDRLQHKERLLTLLEGETDTIGEYVSLYQSQRRALQIQYSQKQVLLDQLQVEKRSMQEDISRLRQLVQHLSLSKPIHDENYQSPETEISEVLEKYPVQHIDTSLTRLSAEDTKQEIMTLLDRIDVFEPNIQDYHGIHMPCPCCTGSLLVV
ncbi:Golgin subfamily A member 2-like [Oopsacas minuta]|uniref:Golgin subfamily A member 2-like n=1 Tax=Oopsacas minuta TaxID=111878 RepID=A0AAV7JXF8_9METZ|nr:Golgin subfamily A member 2-like [Oopsacas minuta]